MSEENHAVEAGGDRTLINPSSAGDIRNGMVAILKGNPCKVAEVRTSKTGKHGHAKCNITGVCIMTGRKFVEMLPSHVAVDIAMVKKVEYQLLDISGETATLMTMDDSGETIDIECTGEEGQKLKEQYTGDDTQDTVVTVQTAPVMINQNYVNQSMIIGFKKVDHV